MSRPTFENIDQWLFEYTEGTLSPAQESQLMDFIRLNPEVITDLKAWKQSKAAPIATPQFSTASLIKPTPLLMRPISLVTIGVVAIFLGLLGFNSFNTIPLYSKVDIDAEIIYAADEDDQALFASIIKQTPKETENKTRQSTSLAKNIESSNKNSRKNIGLPETTLDEETTQFNNTVSQFEIDYNQLNFIQKSFEAKAKDLNDISAYLNGQRENDQEVSNSTAKIISSADVAKMTLKKTINSAYRKIKRMADQPVALRNTKDPYYHTPMMTGYKANSAMVGTAQGNRVQATSRLQWLDKSNTQLMNTLSWDGYVYALRGGLGIDANYNTYKTNALNNYSVGFTYSPKFSINKKVSFEPAMRFKMGVVNVDPNSKVIGSKIEVDRHNIIPLFENETTVSGNQLWYRDLGLGFMLNTEWFYLGFNADNLGRHNNNFYSGDLNKSYHQNIHYIAVLGTEYQSFTRDIKISGYGLFQNFGELNELWLGGNVQYKWLQAGVGVSTNADLGASLGTSFNRFSLHYNIDYTKSRLLNDKLLSHQVTMKILLKPSRYAAKFLNI